MSIDGPRWDGSEEEDSELDSESSPPRMVLTVLEWVWVLVCVEVWEEVWVWEWEWAADHFQFMFTSW